MSEEIIKKIIENYKRLHDIQFKVYKRGKNDDLLNGHVYALEWILEELDYDLDEILGIKEKLNEKM
ncbi:MAG: hypothetical protein E6356_14010 [Terrisporobacter othiniensis]|nr:hypothetical protein [Terrisporobacter othiniensis]